jgi:uncharacterized protein YjfI (DUF2170 family)
MRSILICKLKYQKIGLRVTERENNLEIKLNDIKDLEVSISKESQILMTKKEMYL